MPDWINHLGSVTGYKNREKAFLVLELMNICHPWFHIAETIKLINEFINSSQEVMGSCNNHNLIKDENMS